MFTTLFPARAGTRNAITRNKMRTTENFIARTITGASEVTNGNDPVCGNSRKIRAAFRNSAPIRSAGENRFRTTQTPARAQLDEAETERDTKKRAGKKQNRVEPFGLLGEPRGTAGSDAQSRIDVAFRVISSINPV